MKEDINVTFIIPSDCRSEDDCTEEMQLAFTACEQHTGGGLRPQWVPESEWKRFDGLTKQDVFVISEFKGEIYNKLKATKCLLVGPRCLSCCLMEGTPIPSGPEPVYTIAMRGLIVTASGLSKQQKEHIKQRVHWMGGLYSTVLTEDTTHLVSDTVLSDKYIKAVQRNIPVMSESWIDAVWETSLRLNVSAGSSDFNEHKLPPFANLQITTSSMTKKEKLYIMKLVNENGGKLSGTFQSETTDVVVLTREGVGSEKYKAALEYEKHCVLPAWVKDSVVKGVALPFAMYKVVGASTSSPLAEHRLPDMSLNFSRITNIRPPNNFVDETRAVDISTISGRMKLSQESKKSSDMSMDKSVLLEFEKFDMSCIKKAGPIFDGFCIWITGLEGVCRERAAACISRCGGVRYDSPHERVTHILAGTAAAATSATSALPAVPVINPLWILKSVAAGRTLDEAEFLLNSKPATPVKSRKPHIEPASPMSKRNLQLLRHERLDLPPPTPELPEPQDDLVNHYLSQPQEKTPEPALPHPIAHPDVTEDLRDEPTEEIEQIFRGIKIEVQGLDEEAICEIGAEVAAAGGVLVASGAGGDFILVPLDWDCDDKGDYVTVFWIKDSLCQQELLPIQYYHRPVKLPQWEGAPPLVGVVASLSTYSGVERAFLDELAKLLGATMQLRFCRRNTANAIASTHLICPTPTGDKYQGALKWSLPAVTAQWLLDCAERGTRISEEPYLVGDTKAPQLQTVEEEEERMEAHQTNTTHKENQMQLNIQKRVSVPKDQTPKGKIGNDGDPDNMSPASRYIAMARQGLLGCDSQETPKRLQELKDDYKDGDCTVRTPPLDDALSTPNLIGLSPTTRRRLQAVRRGEMPSDPIRTPVDPFDKNSETPDSAFGAALRPGSGRLSPDNRKRLWKFVSDLPSKPPESGRDKHTPLSEIRNRFLAQFNGDAPTPPSEHQAVPRKLQLEDQVETPPSKMAKMCELQSAGGLNITEDEPSKASSSSTSSTLPPVVDDQLSRLNAALSNRRGSLQRKHPRDTINVQPVPDIESCPQSQPNTVGWDDRSISVKKFMFSSNVDKNGEIADMIKYLGGEICTSSEFDLSATHLLCAAPGRSEKMLGSIAAGKWVLHPAYVLKSRQNGSFLCEEDYEWGNPRASILPPLSESDSALAAAACRWRATRADGHPGPFSGMIALFHVQPARKKLLVRLLEAGGGTLCDDDPPYSNATATVCFADIRRYPLSGRDGDWLKSNKIPVCAPMLLSSFLTDETRPDPVQHCLPEYR